MDNFDIINLNTNNFIFESRKVHCKRIGNATIKIGEKKNKPRYLLDTISSSNKKRIKIFSDCNENPIKKTVFKFLKINTSNTLGNNLKQKSITHDPYGHFQDNNIGYDPFGHF